MLVFLWVDEVWLDGFLCGLLVLGDVSGCLLVGGDMM